MGEEVIRGSSWNLTTEASAGCMCCDDEKEHLNTLHIYIILEYEEIF